MEKIFSIIKATIKPAVIIIIFFGLVSLSLWLKKYSNLSEASFMILVTLSAIFSILIPNLNQLKSFSIAKGELVLQEMRETETSVKELAKAILEVTETSSHGLMLESFDGEAQDRAVEQLRKLTT